MGQVTRNVDWGREISRGHQKAPQLYLSDCFYSETRRELLLLEVLGEVLKRYQMKSARALGRIARISVLIHIFSCGFFKGEVKFRC